jgi:N-dimethylarginine dimethylaminohydrolase
MNSNGSHPRFLMCPPVHYGVRYVINPWMEEGVRHHTYDEASTQWSNLRAVMEGPAGARVETLEPAPGLPDMVFTANAGLVVGSLFVPSRFRYRERSGEEPYFADWARRAGLVRQELPPGVRFEGAGDALFDRVRPILWLGHGFRTDREAAPPLSEILAPLGYAVEPLRLVDPRFYHLDTCFCPLSDGSALYYPKAFDTESIRRLEEVVPREDLIAVDERDAVAFACNAVNVGDKIVLNAASPALRERLERRGFAVIVTPLGDFLYSGGAAKCLTLRLDEPVRAGAFLRSRSE